MAHRATSPEPGCIMTEIATVPIERCNSCKSSEMREIAVSRDFEYASCNNDFLFVQCRNCGLAFLKNRPAIETLDVIYPANYRPHSFNKSLGSFTARIRDIVQQSKIRIIRKYARENSFILDIGCGSGELLRLLHDHGDRSWRLGGIDLAETAVNHIRKMGILGFLGRFETMAWMDAAPDVIIMNQVIEHMEDPSAVVEKAYSILKPGGYLIMETPSMEGWDARWFLKRYWGGWHTPRHWTIYTEDSLIYLLQRSGFEILERNYLLSPTFWLQSLHHWVQEKWRIAFLVKRLDTKFFPALLMASAFDAFQRMVRGKTSNFRVVSQKRSPM